ncbi:Protein of unknown function [Pyronema omphalodes CBS 100304]|uniref:Uncharacterized protein n=1 Tax=Pyronema omphalodes (strain CBS 100304) TaxID=1076935 RepID=U4LKF0_PYROM|nr:Protein of unknown function [Pyronema omphalodes CBS 100304]
MSSAQSKRKQAILRDSLLSEHPLLLPVRVRRRAFTSVDAVTNGRKTCECVSLGHRQSIRSGPTGFHFDRFSEVGAAVDYVLSLIRRAYESENGISVLKLPYTPPPYLRTF